MSDFEKRMNELFYLKRDEEIEDNEIQTTMDLTQYGVAYHTIWKLFFDGDIKAKDKEKTKAIARTLCRMIDNLLPYNLYDGTKESEKLEDYFFNMESQILNIIDNLYE